MNSLTAGLGRGAPAPGSSNFNKLGQQKPLYGSSSQAHASAAAAVAGPSTGISSAKRMQPTAVLPSAAERRHALAAAIHHQAPKVLCWQMQVLHAALDWWCAGAAPDSFLDATVGPAEKPVSAHPVALSSGARAEHAQAATPTTEAADVAGTGAPQHSLERLCYTSIIAGFAAACPSHTR